MQMILITTVAFTNTGKEKLTANMYCGNFLEKNNIRIKNQDRESDITNQ